MTELVVKDILNNTNAISVEQGYKLADVVLVHLTNNNQVVVDFKDVTAITAVFLNIFFNVLSSSYSKDFILNYLKFNNIPDKFLMLIRLVKEHLVNSDSEIISKVLNSIEL
jgi:hypothetical protein